MRARHTHESASMGKAKKKKQNSRFDPLARPPAAMQVDDSAHDEEPPKQLSAHQQRHLERKRLQSEVKSLKKKRSKVSKADKLAWAGEKKALTKSLKTIKAEASALRLAPLGLPAARLAPAPPAVAFQGFDLPTPASSHPVTASKAFVPVQIAQ